MSKTVREWFESLNDPELSRKLIRRSLMCTRNHLQHQKSTLHEALGTAFLWGNTPEGGNYWHNRFHEFKKNPKQFLEEKHVTVINEQYNI